MKIKRLCSGNVNDHQLVKFDDQNLLTPYDNLGEVIGIAENCEMITETDENGNETIVHLSTVSINGVATCILSGTASQNGCLAYASNDKVSSTGTNLIGKILPKEYPRSGDYQDGDIVLIQLN